MMMTRAQTASLLKMPLKETYRFVGAGSIHGMVSSQAVVRTLNLKRRNEKREYVSIPQDITDEDGAASALGITPKQLKRCVSSRRANIPHFRFSRRTVRFSLAALLAWGATFCIIMYLVARYRYTPSEMEKLWSQDIYGEELADWSDCQSVNWSK